jgi:hypothetical protein
VHHANILVDRAGDSRKRETEPGAGFGGMEIRIESQVFDPDSHLLFWKPGTIPYVEPEGMALRLDKGTDLILNPSAALGQAGTDSAEHRALFHAASCNGTAHVVATGE